MSEPLARLGADVTGIDPAKENIVVAQEHARRARLPIGYRSEAVEDVVAAGERFDIVLAMEVVEHVADLAKFMESCAKATKPGGLVLMSTLNRTLRSFGLAILGAEYLLRWLPRGTHDWEKFVTPQELEDEIEAAGLVPLGARGMVFDPLRWQWRLSRDTAVNYVMSAGKPDLQRPHM